MRLLVDRGRGPPARPLGVIFPALGLVAATWGCNLLMDLSRFSKESPGDAGPATDGGAPEGGSDLSCLGLPNESLDPSPVTLHLSVFDGPSPSETPGSIDGGSDLFEVAYTPVPGVTMQACLALDPTCGKPVIPAAATDDAGVVSFPLPGQFTGFLRGTGAGVTPFTFFPGQWMTGLKEASYSVESTTPADNELLSAVLGGALDLDAGAGLGELFVSVFDCLDHKLAGATIALSHTGSETLPFYIIGGIPNTTSLSTDQSGVGGALNVPAGSVHVTATLLAPRVTIGSADVYVRAGENTNAWIRPRVH